MLLHPGYNSDMGKPQRAASLKHEAKFSAALLAVFRKLLSLDVTAGRKDVKHNQ
jgi:hypothetical protein